MSGTIICPKGHSWDLSLDGTPLRPDCPIACPVCGTWCVPPKPAPAPAEAPTGVSISADTVLPDHESGPARLPVIAGYEVIGVLGSGGMGIVYRARDVLLGRMVALKMISAGAHASSKYRQRFQSEATILASLHHPHIVQIFEVGEHDGQPFLSLELLEGGTLERKLGGLPQPPGESAQLVETLARAVAAAHACDIIHRDLKPGNILLAADGTPKVGDFGLAKQLGDEAARTQTGDLLGTPVYMAPEQAAGDPKEIGPRTDVYSLGVILYEMLTGRPPFRGTSTAATMQLVREASPVPPARFQPSVPRDLETICLKCLEKIPTKRYAGATALADDLRRFLNREPILARRTGRLERLGKWAKRRPAVATLLGVASAAIMSLIAVGLWSHARVRAEAQRAEDRLDKARQVVDDMYTQVAEEWLAEEPHRDPLRREFLEKALQLYREFSQDDRTTPEIRRQTALASFRLAQVYRALNEYGEAETAYARAISLQSAMSREFPSDPRYRHDLAVSYNWFGELFRERGDLDSAGRQYRQAQRIQLELVANHPTEPSYRKDLARSHYNLGIIDLDRAQLDDASANLGRAIELLESLCKEFPALPECAHELSRCLINRGVLLRQRKKSSEAERDGREAVRLLGQLRRAGHFRTAHRSDLAIAHQNLGHLLYDQARHSDAIAELNLARPSLERLADDFPTRPVYRKKLANLHNSLASVQWEMGDPANAEENWQKGREILERLSAEFPDVVDHRQHLGIVLGNLGLLKAHQRAFASAREYLRQAIDELRSVLNTNPYHLEGRQAMRDQFQRLAEVSIALDDHVGAVDAATELAAILPERAQDRYYAACFIARAIPVLQRDASIADPAARENLARQHADRAMACLRDAVRLRSAALERVPNDELIFEPLKSEAELATLLRELGHPPDKVPSK